MTGHQALPGVQAPRLVSQRCCGFHLRSRPEPTTPPDGLFQPEHNQSPWPPTPDTSLWSQPNSWGLCSCLGSTLHRGRHHGQAGLSPACPQPPPAPATWCPTRSIPAHLSSAARMSPPADFFLCRLRPQCVHDVFHVLIPSSSPCRDTVPKGGLSPAQVSEAAAAESREEQRGAGRGSSSQLRQDRGSVTKPLNVRTKARGPITHPTSEAPPCTRLSFLLMGCLGSGVQPELSSFLVGPPSRLLWHSRKEIGRPLFVHASEHVSSARLGCAREGRSRDPDFLGFAICTFMWPSVPTSAHFKLLTRSHDHGVGNT